MTNNSILNAIINPITLDESILDQNLLYSSNIMLTLHMENVMLGTIEEKEKEKRDRPRTRRLDEMKKNEIYVTLQQFCQATRENEDPT